MGCAGCGSKSRRHYPVITSANLNRPITPAQSAANAIANAGGEPQPAETTEPDPENENKK